MVLPSVNIVAQNYTSESYSFSKTRSRGYRIKHLTSAQHQEKVWSNVKKGFDHLERQFTFDGKPFRWELHSQRPSVLYFGDSIAAESTDVLRINNVVYEFAKYTDRSFAFLRNGREVIRGFMFKDKNGTTIRVDTIEDQVECQQILSVVAAFTGLRVLEQKRTTTTAGWLFFLGAVGTTVALEHLDHKSQKAQ